MAGPVRISLGEQCLRSDPQLVFPHPYLIPIALELNFVHELADQVNASSVIGLQVFTPLWIG